MAQTCPTCSRANPAEAVYCYHDGAALRGGKAATAKLDPGSRPFLSPFVFPSGLACHTFDQLALACVNHWPEARNLLREGYLAGFLGSLGRADLARAATEAARYPDPDRGLDQLLAQLPGKALVPAKLVVQPRQVNLGHLRAGTDRKLDLHLSNDGMGLLYGSVACEDCPWLTVGEGQGVSGKMFQMRAESVIAVQVRGQHLRAGNKPLQGRIVVRSNGGDETILVTAEVPVVPFPEGALAGAKSPRQVAEKAKANPKGAAALFENGAVAAWYQANGWSYPVLGPAASGLAAVQQFFEALGLTAPPKVELSEATVTIFCKPGQTVRHTLVVSSPEKRPVYARAVSNRSWLKIAGVKMEGRTASVQVASAVPDQPGETLQATVTVTSNGNQRFEVPFVFHVAGSPRRGPGKLDVLEEVEELEEVGLPELTAAAPLGIPELPRAGQAALAAVLVEPSRMTASPPVRQKVPVLSEELVEEPEEVPAEGPRRRRPRAGSRWQHAWPVAFLVVGLLTAFIRDLVVGSGTEASGEGPPAELDEGGGPGGTIALRFHDTPLPVSVGASGFKPGGQVDRNRVNGTWEPTMRFGLLMVEDSVLSSGKPKQLTFKETGLTNNTCVRLDGQEFLFGEKQVQLSNGKLWPPGRWPGRWRELATPTGFDGQGRRSVWFYDDQKISITQTVEVVRGVQSGRPDTCMVRYRIDNQDGRAHTVGLRFLLDTFIGGNDGVPFLIPGQRELCSSSLDFRPPTPIPDFLQALENESLTSPGTVAQLQLRLGGNLEPPTRVTIGAYPNPRLGQQLRDPRCRQEKTLWEVPVYPMKTLPPGDSAVVLYWDPRRLGAGESREVGFSYGLGSVAGRQGKGKLALTVGGSFQAGGEFTATAYVSNPQPGQTIKLTVPEGFELIDKDATQEVPQPAASARRISPVSWRVRSPRRETKAELEARLSTGLTQKVPVRITIKDIFGN